jgi:hypothetical membrane protein
MAIQESRRRQQLTAALGAASVVAALGGIALAAALSPWFSPFRHALSNLGQTPNPAAPLFNLGLLLAGALGAGFVVAVWSGTDDGIRQAALVVLFPAMVFLGLVGAFPLPGLLHFVVAPLFFLFMTLGVALWGAGDWAVGRRERGGALVVAATLHLVSWVWWLLYGWTAPGIAVPELVGSGALAAWALWVGAERWPTDTERDQL